MKYIPLLLSLAASLLFQTAARAESLVPKLMNYQGYLTDSSGLPLGNGASENRDVTFRFWNNPTNVADENRLYSESHTVTILDGNFSVLLGNGSPVADEANAVASFNALFDHAVLFLGITVDDGDAGTTDAEITPRQQLVSTAFAFRAAVAERVDAQAITADQISPGTITANEIANGSILAADIDAAAVWPGEIATGAVDTAEIAADAVTAAKIATGAVTSAEIANGTILGEDIATNTITQGKIANDSIGAGELLSNSVKAEHLAAGTVRAGTDTEVLRIVRGTVSGTGVKVEGKGWSSARSSGDKGHYKVTFNQAFSDYPSVTATYYANGGDGKDDNHVMIKSVGTGWFTLYMRDNNADDTKAGGLEDDAFMFIAVGPVAQ